MENYNFGCVICREDCMYFVWKTCVNCQSLFHPECLGQDPNREDPFWCSNCSRARLPRSGQEELVSEFEKCSIQKKEASLTITGAAKISCARERLDCRFVEWQDWQSLAFAFQTCLSVREFQSALLRPNDGLCVFKQGMAYVAIIHLPDEDACFASNGAGKFYIESMLWDKLKPGFYSISHLLNTVTSCYEFPGLNPNIKIAIRGALDLQKAYRIDKSNVRFVQADPKSQIG